MANDNESVVISIDENDWRFWESIEVTLSVDNFSTVSFTSVFEPDQQLFRDTFRPFTFKDLTVKVGELGGLLEQIFTGQLVGVQPRTTPNKVMVECSGYALPGVLADAAAPVSAFPLEFNGQNLLQIAEKLCEPFGIEVGFDGDPGTAFRRVKVEVNDKIYDFLGKLAKQRDYIMTSTPAGGLRFLRTVDSGVPVVKLKEGQQPLQSVAATFDAQSYYSEITGFARTKPSSRGSRYTVNNPKLNTTVRSMSFVADDVKAPDLPTAVQAKMARMFGNMVQYVVEIPSWRDPQGNLWQPNTLVNLEAPGAMVYNETTFLVRDVFLQQDANETFARLGLVLPGSFSGKIPAVFPWD